VCGTVAGDIQRIGDDLTSYYALLQRPLQPHDVYDLKETKNGFLDEPTKRARGGLRRRMEPLVDIGDEHNYSNVLNEATARERLRL
jgi:hypothetical protein